MYFAISLLSPLYKIESSSPKDAWCKVWFRQCIFTLSLLSPRHFEIDIALHLHSLHPRLLCASLIESGSREEHFKFSTMNFRNFVKVGHSSNFLYQGFAEKNFSGIFLHSKV